MDEIKAQKKALKKAYKQAKRKNVLAWKILTILCAVVMVISVPLSVLAQKFDNSLAAFYGGTFWRLQNEDTNAQYFTGDFNSAEEMVNYGLALTQQVEAEGAALLMNNNNALPLAADAKVSTFSNSSVNLVYGGTGSGNIDASTADTLRTALEKVGVTVNPTLWDFYTVGAGKDYARSKSGTVATASEVTAEVPWDVYTDDVKNSVAQYGDAAIVTLSRVGGEGADLAYGDVNYLALDENEKAMLQNVAEMKKNGIVKKTIVLINSANALQVDFLKNNEYDIDAALWIGDVGISGINAVAEILTGKVNPSGSLVDTYCYDNFSAPAMWNFTPTTYEGYVEGGDVSAKAKSYMIYQEGIYVGYKYYETRYEDFVTGSGNAGDYAYGDTVAYPFGYGDSYTTFAYSNFNVTESDDAFTVTLKVTNTGKTFSGKETVQIYFQSPYTAYDKANGIEKAAAELCGFAKTDVLAPGASEDVTITVPKSELRTYDANNAKTYIVDAGDYYFTAATDSHNAVNNILAAKGYTVENTNGRMTENGSTDLVWKWTNDTLDTTTFSTGANGTAITNLFDESDPNKSSDAPGSVTWMSRSDWTGTIPTAPAQLTANETLAASLAFTKYDGSEANSVEMPTLGAKNGLTLASMIGKDFDDPEWDTLLDQLTYSEMVQTITLGFHNTAAAASIGKTATKDENGPQGLTAALTGGASAMCYTSEDVMAATFNVDLINEVGRCIGEDCLAMGYSGLYGPGINMHRTAYCGRNFEYYSEDPFVAGTICAAEVQGIQSKGVYVYLKHVALNDSETSRRGVNTWLNEQTAREIYLEVADKAITDGGAWSVMTGFNRWGATWCGANANLLTGFLRGELGMRGMCITDFSGSSQYMDLVDGLIAGSDIWDSPTPKIHTTKAANYENDAYIVTQMRNAMHHILYTVVNSNAMNGWASTDTLKTITPWWQTAIYALIAVLAVLTILCAWQLSKALKAKKSMVDTAPAANQK